MLVKSYVDRGILVPDDIMTRLMLPRLEQLSAHSWLLDGESNNLFMFIHVPDSCIWPVFIRVPSFVTTVFRLLCRKEATGLLATPQIGLVRLGSASKSPELDKT